MDNIEVIVKLKDLLKSAFKKTVDSFSRDSRRMEDRAKRSTVGVTKSFFKMANAIKGLVAGTVAVALVQVTKHLIKVGGDAEETEAKFKVVFKNTAKESEVWVNRMNKSLGLSRSSLQRYASDIGQVLNSTGLFGKELHDVSTQITEMALDLASFSNVPFDQAILAFRSALVGEREALKTLGIAVLEADVKHKALQLGLNTSSRDALKYARIIATTKILEEKTTLAKGDLIRTGGSLTNQTRKLSESWKALKEDLANSTGVLFGIVIVLKEIVAVFSLWGSGIKKLVTLHKRHDIEVKRLTESIEQYKVNLRDVKKGTDDYSNSIKDGKNILGDYTKQLTELQEAHAKLVKDNRENIDAQRQGVATFFLEEEKDLKDQLKKLDEDRGQASDRVDVAKIDAKKKLIKTQLEELEVAKKSAEANNVYTESQKKNAERIDKQSEFTRKYTSQLDGLKESVEDVAEAEAKSFKRQDPLKADIDFQQGEIKKREEQRRKFVIGQEFFKKVLIEKRYRLEIEHLAKQFDAENKINEVQQKRIEQTEAIVEGQRQLNAELQITIDKYNTLGSIKLPTYKDIGGRGGDARENFNILDQN